MIYYLRNKKLILFTTLTILWIAFIFSFSLQTGTESSAISGGVVERVLGILGLSNFPHAEFLETIIRKMAHFAEYFVLGVLMSMTIRQTKCNRRILTPWAIATIVAACDETIQLFSAGRSGQITDVILDSCGVLVGCVVILKICELFEKSIDDKNVQYTI